MVVGRHPMALFRPQPVFLLLVFPDKQLFLPPFRDPSAHTSVKLTRREA